MTTGLRPIADARSRAFDDPRVQTAWQTLDCGFGSVADVFTECYNEASRQLDPMQLAAYVQAARKLGKLGRGAEPLLMFLEEWPAIVIAAPGDHDNLLSQVMHAIDQMHQSPNSRAITGFLQTLAPVSRKLRAASQIESYIGIGLDLMQRTSGSIHGRQTTFPSPGLPCFFAQAPRLISLLSPEGLKRWVDFGVVSHFNHPERQEAYFNLLSPDSLAVLQRERHGTLFVDVERRLDLYLRALWQASDQMVPYSTMSSASFAQVMAPYYDDLGYRIPDVYDDLSVPMGVCSAEDRYRAVLAHMVGHKRWSVQLVADNWSPFQRMAVEIFEDSRVDRLLVREYPGLHKVLLAIHPQPLEAACDSDTMSCLRHRLTLISRACLDPKHTYRNPELLDFVSQFNEAMTHGASTTSNIAKLALAYVAKTRRQSDQYANVFFDDTVVSYRDDNRHLWKFIENSDDEDFFDAAKQHASEGLDIQGLPPRHYPEWDYATRSYRPDWTSVYEALHPSGNSAAIDRLLEKHAALSKRLKRLLDLLKPQDKVRIRYQEEGSELDLDVALRSLIDYRSGVTPDPRINMSHRTSGRDISVLLLVDQSASLNQHVAAGTGTQTILELSQEAVALLAWVMDGLGDPLCIAGFHSNTRHEIRYQHIKGFSERWDDTVKARAAAMAASYSTRMGAALRHAGHYLNARSADKKILLVLTDGEPSDVDVDDAVYLRADSRKAVEELSAKGISTFCLSLDPKADQYVSEIFGNRWRVLDRIERLPEQLPLLYLSLTK